MTEEEIDKEMNEFFSSHKGDVKFLDLWDKDLSYDQITWEDFFVKLPEMKKIFKDFIIIKNKSGPIIIWGNQ